MIVKAIQKVSITDSHGKRTTLYVPGHVTKQNIADAMRVAEFQSIKFGGMFTQFVYHAYIECIDWFRFKKPKSFSPIVKDYLSRIERSLKRNTDYQTSLVDKNFIEPYFGRLISNSIGNFRNLRSAMYDVTKKYMDAEKALDASFVGLVYVLACSECAVMDRIIDITKECRGVNLKDSLRTYRIDDIIQLAERLLKENWGFDVNQHEEEVKSATEYLVNDLCETTLNEEAEESAVAEAFEDMDENKKKLLSSMGVFVESKNGNDGKE